MHLGERRCPCPHRWRCSAFTSSGGSLGLCPQIEERGRGWLCRRETPGAQAPAAGRGSRPRWLRAPCCAHRIPATSGAAALGSRPGTGPRCWMWRQVVALINRAVMGEVVGAVNARTEPSAPLQVGECCWCGTGLGSGVSSERDARGGREGCSQALAPLLSLPFAPGPAPLCSVARLKGKTKTFGSTAPSFPEPVLYRSPGTSVVLKARLPTRLVDIDVCV